MDNKLSKYRADIDGLRALAVLGVLFFHANLGVTGGFVGVDVFFVISGYLITGLIIKDLDHGRFQIMEFFERRARRIFPALVVVVVVSIIAGWFLFLPLDFVDLGQSVVAQSLIASNVYFWQTSGYFSQAAEVKPLLHTWSLAVEEQFYLLFPILLIVINAFSRRSLVTVILLLVTASLSLSIFCTYSHASVAFFLLPSRAWELLMGSLLAVMPARYTVARWLTELLSWCGLLAILMAMFLYDQETRFPGVAALAPCVGAAAVIWASSNAPTSLGKLLSTRPIVFIGLISYSLYLWHWPLLVFAKYICLGPIQPVQRLLLLLTSVVLAILSWRFVETPFRQRLILKSRVQIFSMAGSMTALLLCMGFAISIFHGFSSRIPSEALRYANGSITDAAQVQNLSYKVGLKELLAGDLVELGPVGKEAPIDFVVWGDSHAAAVIPVLDALSEKYSVRGAAAMYASTPPLRGYQSTNDLSLKEDSPAYSDAVVKFILNNRVRNVILVAKWGGYVSDSGPERVRSGLIETIDALKETSPRIWIMRQIPMPRWSVPRALAIGVLQGVNTENLGIPFDECRRESQRQNPAFDGLSEDFPSVTLLDPIELFVGRNQLCRLQENGRALYCDDSHLSSSGAMLLSPLFDPVFRSISKSSTD